MLFRARSEFELLVEGGEDGLVEEMLADALAGFRWYLAAHDEMDACDARS